MQNRINHTLVVLVSLVAGGASFAATPEKSTFIPKRTPAGTALTDAIIKKIDIPAGSWVLQNHDAADCQDQDRELSFKNVDDNLAAWLGETIAFPSINQSEFTENYDGEEKNETCSTKTKNNVQPHLLDETVLQECSVKKHSFQTHQTLSLKDGRLVYRFSYTTLLTGKVTTFECVYVRAKGSS